jgi:pimeloyl-ACP methyl ester carboxylesterase
VTLIADDTDVHSIRWEATAGRPARGRALLLHGLGGTSIHWALVGDRIARAYGVDVTAIDLAGFGLTRAHPEGATVGANAELVLRVLENEGPAVLVGNSMGGAIAIIAAARRPDLVTALVLVTSVLPQPPWPKPQYPILPHNWMAAMPHGGLAVAAYTAARSDERLVDERLQRSFFDLDRVDPAVRTRLIDLAATRRGFTEAPFTYASATRTLFGYALSLDGIARDMARVRCPTQLIHGREDRLVPLALAEAALDRRPDWELDVIESCGHLPQLERPDTFVELARLIAQ